MGKRLKWKQTRNSSWVAITPSDTYEIQITQNHYYRLARTTTIQYHVIGFYSSEKIAKSVAGVVYSHQFK